MPEQFVSNDIAEVKILDDWALIRLANKYAVITGAFVYKLANLGLLHL